MVGKQRFRIFVSSSQHSAFGSALTSRRDMIAGRWRTTQRAQEMVRAWIPVQVLHSTGLIDCAQGPLLRGRQRPSLSRCYLRVRPDAV